MPTPELIQANLPEKPQVSIELSLSELQHDVPTDETHIAVLARSIATSGQLSSILVWQNDGQIIDGFHRRDALQLLGRDKANCTIIDCSPEEFRDARITSAVTHKGVLFPRVVLWARDAFATTPWADRLKPSEAFQLTSKRPFNNAYARFVRANGLAPEEAEELHQWIEGKSERWGLNVEQISNMLFLAEKTSPSLIPLVRETKERKRPVLTRAMLRRIVEGVSNHAVQEAIAQKAMAEHLDAADVLILVNEYIRAGADKERKKLLSTSWLDISKRHQEQENAKWQTMTGEFRSLNATKMVYENLIQAIEWMRSSGFNKDNSEAVGIIKQALRTFQEDFAQVTGEDVDLVHQLQQEKSQLQGENNRLKGEVKSLTVRNEALSRALGIAREIHQRDLQSGQDKA